MYYKAEFIVMGRTPNEEDITKAFEEDERVKNPKAVIREPAEMNFDKPSTKVDEPPNKGIGFDKMAYDGVLDPARGHLFFQTPEEYVPNTVMDIFDAGMDRLNVPLELIYIDANSETFSDN